MDWKLHKLICKILKKLSHQLQPYQEVVTVIMETNNELPKKQDLEVRALRHLIAYAEDQFGDRVEGKPYRERGNGDRMDNWNVELVNLLAIYIRLALANVNDGSLSIIAHDDLIFPYLEKQRDLLRPWSAYVDLDSNSLRDCLSGDQINLILQQISYIETNIALIHLHRN
jgi:hypothetical protein